MWAASCGAIVSILVMLYRAVASWMVWWGGEMREKVDGIDPLRFTISRQEFFIDGDVTFSVDACSGFPWWPFDDAVDVFIMEAFVD